MVRQTSSCSCVPLQSVGMDLWLLQTGCIPQFLLQDLLPVLPCGMMEFYRISGLLRDKTLLGSPCLNHSGIRGHIPVRMLKCWGDLCRLDHAQGGMWGCSCRGLIQGSQSRGNPPALAVGMSSQESLSRQAFKKDKTAPFLLVFWSSLDPELMEVMSVH